jgi:hypothetical protein
MYKIKIHKNDFTGIETTAIVDVDKNMGIPNDPDNTDYQAYLKWVEAGNTPEPADEQGA